MRTTNHNKTYILLGIGGIFLLGLFCLTLLQGSQIHRSFLSIMTLPIILGVLFENRRLGSDWKSIFEKTAISLVLSLVASLCIEGIQNFYQLISWPYIFIISFTVLSVIYQDNKLVPKITEGITLLQSISVIYWVIDIGFLNSQSFVAYGTMAIGLLFCLVSFIHAFSYLKLTRKARLFLSFWSSIVMIIFAIDHIYRVLISNFGMLHTNIDLGTNILQHFLLGVSLIYIFKNISLLLGYLSAGKDASEEEIKENTAKMNNIHLERYSENQSKISHSVFVFIFTSALYLLNYTYQLIPGHTLIWLVFWIFPFVALLKNHLGKTVGLKTKQKGF